MRKTILFRLFGIGAIPKKIRPVLDSEGVVIADEGMGGRLITRNVKGPGKLYRYRTEGFSGCLVVTKKRIVCFTYGKRQMHIAVDDPMISNLYVENPQKEYLSVSFESGVFRKGWSGIMEFRFKTDKAGRFYDALTAAGVRPGKVGKK